MRFRPRSGEKCLTIRSNSTIFVSRNVKVVKGYGYVASWYSVTKLVRASETTGDPFTLSTIILVPMQKHGRVSHPCMTHGHDTQPCVPGVEIESMSVWSTRSHT
ncbi:putative aconitate hydratase, mitochondrial [Gossypium arboreum]|uniref:Putative aconitate hydratase, mitochondrial n=1 Tax=Gossypium arboreum TaxID=29729 RepID=A0A0B0NGK4_GOSAR|nr:putative aconitate hydratase, mitochondrial [Gossypium arboreum]